MQANLLGNSTSTHLPQRHRKLVTKQTSVSSKGKVLVYFRGFLGKIKRCEVPWGFSQLLCPQPWEGEGWERWGFLHFTRSWPGLAEVCLAKSRGER